MTPVLLGLDPGFASVGYAVLALRPTARVLEFGVFQTAASSKKLKVASVEDNVRRAQEISAFLFRLLEGQPSEGRRVIAMAAESMSFPRSSSVAAKVAMMWGVLAGMSIPESFDTPILQLSPQDVKKALCGTKSASKEDVQLALVGRYPEVENFRAAIVQGQWEHPHDALAVAHVAMSSTEVVMALRAARVA